MSAYENQKEIVAAYHHIISDATDADLDNMTDEEIIEREHAKRRRAEQQRLAEQDNPEVVKRKQQEAKILSAQLEQDAATLCPYCKNFPARHYYYYSDRMEPKAIPFEWKRLIPLEIDRWDVQEHVYLQHKDVLQQLAEKEKRKKLHTGRLERRKRMLSEAKHLLDSVRELDNEIEDAIKTDTDSAQAHREYYQNGQ